jgi:hypothetical protein
MFNTKSALTALITPTAVVGGTIGGHYAGKLVAEKFLPKAIAVAPIVGAATGGVLGYAAGSYTEGRMRGIQVNPLSGVLNLDSERVQAISVDSRLTLTTGVIAMGQEVLGQIGSVDLDEINEAIEALGAKALATKGRKAAAKVAAKTAAPKAEVKESEFQSAAAVLNGIGSEDKAAA